MTIDWLSLFLGFAIALVLLSLLNMLTSYIKLRKARARVDEVTDKLKQFQSQIQRRRDELLGQIEKEKK